ncbi:MAG: imidazole glycerol phosphate synthase subunit HisH [Candidatus Promineifilaceae bacterium]|nr:imidazole glycerol phosphate synthase subunit HisH [Candidatus Promineifilaceae bacterium]
MTTVTMIDYGLGNVRSVQKALEHVGAEVALTADPDVIRSAGKLVLPGVGAFGAGMAALRERGLVPAIQEAVEQGAALLGICLGMQLLFEESEERGKHRGLALLPGWVVRFPVNDLKVPHVGWNRIEHDGDHPLLAGVPSGAYAYFVHSFYCAAGDPDDVIASTEYGLRFPAIASRGNVAGIQFHPEKSQHVGLRILRNFVQATGGNA